MFKALSVCLFMISGLAFADTYVHGYTRSDGTYVQPHYRSSPDGSFHNNWSTKGNTNPYTGEQGNRVTPPNGYHHGRNNNGNHYGDGFRNNHMGGYN